MTHKLNYKTAVLCHLIASILFGTGYIGSAILLDRGVTPLELIAGRLFVSTIIINAMFFKKLKTITKNELIGGMVLGGSMFGMFLFQVLGLQHTTPSVSAFISSTYVVVVPFMHWVYYKKAPDIYVGIGATLTVIGVALISFGNGTGGDIGLNLGVIFSLICALFTALQIFSTEVYSEKNDPLNLTVVMITTCFLLSLVFGVVSVNFLYQNPYHHYQIAFQRDNIIILLLLSVFSTLMPYTLDNVGQKYVSATKASLIMSTEAIFATMFSILIFGEILSLQMVIGCILIVLAILITQTKLQFKKIFK